VHSKLFGSDNPLFYWSDDGDVTHESDDYISGTRSLHKCENLIVLATDHMTAVD
jgi:hypothetical protein